MSLHRLISRLLSQSIILQDSQLAIMDHHRPLSPAQCPLHLSGEGYAGVLPSGPHTAATGSATAAEKTKVGLHSDQDEEVPLLAGAQAVKPSGSKQSASSLYTSDDELARPIVTGGHSARLGYCAHY